MMPGRRRVTALDAYVSRLPWPAGKAPVVFAWTHGGVGFEVMLRAPVAKGWHVLAHYTGPTMEGTLRLALGRWLEESGLQGCEELSRGVSRLVN